MTRRRFLYLALAVIALGAFGAGYTVYWRYVAQQLETGIAAWAENERAAGRIANFSSGNITGFPFAFQRDFSAVELVQPIADGLVTLEAAQLTASMRPWGLGIIDVSSALPIEIMLQSPAQGESGVVIATGEGQIRLRPDGRLEQITLQGRDVVYSGGIGAHAAAQVAVTLALPPLKPRDHREPLADFDLALTALRLPEGQRALTAEPIERVALVGTVMGPVQAGLPPRAALAQWAAGGGTVELTKFAFAQAPLDLEGSGTLALDARQQLLGALTISALGLTETIDLLASEGMIEAKAARTGRMMAEGLAKIDEKGRKAVRISLSLQQGFFWMGPIRLAPLPVLTW